MKGKTHSLCSFIRLFSKHCCSVAIYPRMHKTSLEYRWRPARSGDQFEKNHKRNSFDLELLGSYVLSIAAAFLHEVLCGSTWPRRREDYSFFFNMFWFITLFCLGFVGFYLKSHLSFLYFFQNVLKEFYGMLLANFWFILLESQNLCPHFTYRIREKLHFKMEKNVFTCSYVQSHISER